MFRVLFCSESGTVAINASAKRKGTNVGLLDDLFGTSESKGNIFGAPSESKGLFGGTSYSDSSGKHIGSSSTGLFGGTSYSDSSGKHIGSSSTGLFGDTNYSDSSGKHIGRPPRGSSGARTTGMPLASEWMVRWSDLRGDLQRNHSPFIRGVIFWSLMPDLSADNVITDGTGCSRRQRPCQTLPFLGGAPTPY